MKRWLFTILVCSLFLNTVHAQSPLCADVRALNPGGTLPCVYAAPPVTVDYSEILQQILVLDQDTNARVRHLDKTFGHALKTLTVFVGKYVAPAIAAYVAARKLP